ncbi:pentapeptide repeat-containing protein [Paenibacillus alkaliterrae]|uniref:pentapeptide repeat-containing protein n=1 Tax=Paenibacillus alkaliterrae TaxID=320909 RepID=UPI001F29738F|nr:pentapeptide repeat-containing protein [Paenibacillus alkaliterrae]MCF2939565.1 pentapeptide repeat-containing protein [Paenibacillus alkaliterrae]
MTSKKEKLEAPKIPDGLAALAVSDDEWADEHEISDSIIQDCHIHNQSAYKACFDRVVFNNAVFRGTSLRKAEFTDVRFENCDLSNIELSETIMHRVSFHNCKLLGMDITGSALRNVLFEHCYADYAVLRFTNAKGVKFDKGSLAKADMSNMTLSKFYLQETNIDQVQLSQTKLGGIDISSCEFNGLGVSMEDLRRCIISPAQAITLATIFGLVVNRED